MNGTEFARGMPNPVGERGAVEGQTPAREDLALPVERKMVGILRDQDLCDQGLGGQAAGDQPRRGRRLHHALGAAAAGVSGPAGDEHPELRQDDVEPL